MAFANTRMSFVNHVLVCRLYVARVSFACHLYVFVFTRTSFLLLVCTCVSFVCTRMSSVCHSYVFLP